MSLPAVGPGACQEPRLLWGCPLPGFSGPQGIALALECSLLFAGQDPYTLAVLLMSSLCLFRCSSSFQLQHASICLWPSLCNDPSISALTSTDPVSCSPGETPRGNCVGPAHFPRHSVACWIAHDLERCPISCDLGGRSRVVLRVLLFEQPGQDFLPIKEVRIHRQIVSTFAFLQIVSFLGFSPLIYSPKSPQCS